MKAWGDILNGRDKELVSQELKRKTFYLRDDQITAIKLMATLEDKAEYNIIVEALDKYIPKKYFDMARTKKE